MSEKQLPPIDDPQVNPLDAILKPAAQIFLAFLLFMSFFAAGKSIYASSIAPAKKAQPGFAEALQNNPINSLTLTLSTLTFLALGAIILTVLKRRAQSTAPLTIHQHWKKAPPAAIGLLILLMLWVGTQFFTAPVIAFLIPGAFASSNPTLTEEGQDPHDIDKSKAYVLTSLVLPKKTLAEDALKKDLKE
ncbi:MAG: hypothetical protein P1V97_38160, partial [Planctomycetota bacterium]|nr:hypothetical protein [Planctomycetota bacterium]